jgi:hypothetical protein
VHVVQLNDYGPVQVSRIKAESTPIFDALAHGRRVLVSKHGRVVAAIDPPDVIPHELIIDYALPGDRHFAELSASDINQRSPSAAVAAALEGDRVYVTKDNVIYGLLRQFSPEEFAAQLPSAAQVADRERRIDEFIERNPQASAEDVVALTEAIAKDEALSRSLIRYSDLWAKLMTTDEHVAECVRRIEDRVERQHWSAASNIQALTEAIEREPRGTLQKTIAASLEKSPVGEVSTSVSDAVLDSVARALATANEIDHETGAKSVRLLSPILIRHLLVREAVSSSAPQRTVKDLRIDKPEGKLGDLLESIALNLAVARTIHDEIGTTADEARTMEALARTIAEDADALAEEARATQSSTHRRRRRLLERLRGQIVLRETT